MQNLNIPAAEMWVVFEGEVFSTAGSQEKWRNYANVSHSCNQSSMTAKIINSEPLIEQTTTKNRKTDSNETYTEISTELYGRYDNRKMNQEKPHLEPGVLLPVVDVNLPQSTNQQLQFPLVKRLPTEPADP